MKREIEPLRTLASTLSRRVVEDSAFIDALTVKVEQLLETSFPDDFLVVDAEAHERVNSASVRALHRIERISILDVFGLDTDSALAIFDVTADVELELDGAHRTSDLAEWEDGSWPMDTVVTAMFDAVVDTATVEIETLNWASLHI